MMTVLVFLGVVTIGAISAEADTFDLNGNHPGPGVSEVMGFGSANDGSAGVPVAGGFDCDGDGHRDTAFSLIQADPLGRGGAGLALLVFGDGTIDGPSINAETAQAGVLKVAGATAQEVCGAEVWMDDLTGDGIGDFIIGRQNYDSVSGNDDAGALTILVGGTALRTYAATLATLDLASPPAGVKILTFEGMAAGNRLGIWMRTGDITGDGIADLVVGEDQADDRGEDSGAVWVIRGGPHLATAPATVDLADFGVTPMEGHLARILPPPGSVNYHLGATCQVGDLDGNGRAEVLAAAALNRAGAALGGGEPRGGPFRGALFISWDENFPPWLWPAGYEFEIMNPPIGDFTRINGGIVGPFGDLTGRHSKFGEEILAGRDYSGDGCPDLFVGDITGSIYENGNLSLSAAGLGHVFWNCANLRGKEFGMSAVPTDIAFNSIFGPLTGALSSDTVAHGDYDGDGIDDAIVGNPHDAPSGRTDAGTVHVLYGQPGGWPEFINLEDGELPEEEELRFLEIYGASAFDVLCYSAATGDIDRDGKDDFIVNEMKGDNTLATPAQIGVGNLLVISGGTMLPPPTFSLGYTPSGLVEFGAVAVSGGSAVSKTVVITNTSGGTVALQSLELAGPQNGPYAINSDTGETSLGPGETRTVMIDFLPSTTGWFGAGLVVSTDADEYRSGVGLKGAGVGAVSSADLSRFSVGDGGEVRMLFDSAVGYVYDVLRGSALPPLGLQADDVPGTGAPVPVIDLAPLSTRNVFYQVRGQPVP